MWSNFNQVQVQSDQAKLRTPKIITAPKSDFADRLATLFLNDNAENHGHNIMHRH